MSWLIADTRGVGIKGFYIGRPVLVGSFDTTWFLGPSEATWFLTKESAARVARSIEGSKILKSVAVMHLSEVLKTLQGLQDWNEINIIKKRRATGKITPRAAAIRSILSRKQ